jgi:hypothetical protein
MDGGPLDPLYFVSSGGGKGPKNLDREFAAVTCPGGSFAKRCQLRWHNSEVRVYKAKMHENRGKGPERGKHPTSGPEYSLRCRMDECPYGDTIRPDPFVNRAIKVEPLFEILAQLRCARRKNQCKERTRHDGECHHPVSKRAGRQ